MDAHDEEICISHIRLDNVDVGMSAKFFLGVVVLLILTAPGLHAQSQFPGVRLIVGRHGQSMFRNPGLDEAEGVLTVDAQARRLLFVASRRNILDVPLAAMVALHYEESSYPRRVFGRRGLYLTVHYSGSTSERQVAIFRLPRESVEDCLAALAKASGQPVDRSPSTTSFLGLPIHTGIGDVVYVTQNDGRRTKGTVTEMGLTGIQLSASGPFDEPSVRQVQVNDPIWGGVVLGAGLFVVPAGFASWSGCLDRCSTLGFLTPGGWSIVAAGALIGGVIDKQVMRHAFRRTTSKSSRSGQSLPVLARRATGFELTLSF